MRLLKIRKIPSFLTKNPIRVMLICVLIGVLFVVYNIISANAQPKALLIVEFGNVYYSYDNQNYLKVEVKEFDIGSGVYIKTDQGKAHIVLPNNSVLTVDEQTNIFLTYNPSSIDILQIIGNTWHRVKNLGGTGYNVKTPNAIAAVRGTEFSIQVNKVDDQISTQVVVTEHQVDLSPAQPPQVALTVMEGMVGEVKGENEFKVSKISKEMKESDWFKENQDLTETLKSTESEDKQKNSANVIKLKSEESEKQNKTTENQQNQQAVPTATPTPTVTPTSVPTAGSDGEDSNFNTGDVDPTPVPTPLPGEVYIDQVVSVNGTFGHCCGDIISTPSVAASLVTGAPDSPPALNFIQISDNSDIILKFVNNKVVDRSGADIRIYVYDDLYPAYASFAIARGPDCASASYVSVGTYVDTSNVSIDISSSRLGSVQCLKITDLTSEGDPYPQLGFDLDAVEALHSEIVQ